jgi:16S rRNA (guanine527-N7)-methyltransferase
VRIGGKFISMKLSDARDEIIEAEAAISALGGKISQIEKVKIPFTDITHSLIVIDKIVSTPGKYPRKAGKVAKSPIK